MLTNNISFAHKREKLIKYKYPVKFVLTKNPTSTLQKSYSKLLHYKNLIQNFSIILCSNTFKGHSVDILCPYL